MSKPNIGTILAERRKLKRLTLKSMSNMSGVSTSYIGRVENGNRFPSALVLRKLAKPLDFGELELLKIAGFVQPDEIDTRIEKFKAEITISLLSAFTDIYRKINSL